MNDPVAVCVTGVTAELAGVVLFEQLVFDYTSRLQPTTQPSFAKEPIVLSRLHALRRSPRHNIASLHAPPKDVLLQELAALRDLSGPAGCTVVECTASGSGRDPAALLALSKQSGVRICMAVGVTVDELRACPDDPAEAGEPDETMDDVIVDRLVSEV